VTIPFVVGCANLSASKVQLPEDANKVAMQPVMEKEISTFLASAAPLSTSGFASTPWGENVLVQVGESYFSASGRNCRKLTVLDNAGDEKLQLACEFRNGSWEPVRLVTQLLGVQ